MNAARARKRTKDRISGLCMKVEEQAGLNTKLQKKNKELIERVERLAEENQDLRRIALHTRSLPFSSAEAPTPLFSADAGTTNMFQQQLPGHLVNVSGLLPLLQQKSILGFLPGGGLPQMLSPADQQRLLRTQMGFNEQPPHDPSSLQSALFLQKQGLSSFQPGTDAQPSDQQYFDLVRSVLACKGGHDAPQENQQQLQQQQPEI